MHALFLLFFVVNAVLRFIPRTARDVVCNVIRYKLVVNQTPDKSEVPHARSVSGELPIEPSQGSIQVPPAMSSKNVIPSASPRRSCASRLLHAAEREVQTSLAMRRCDGSGWRNGLETRRQPAKTCCSRRAALSTSGITKTAANASMRVTSATCWPERTGPQRTLSRHAQAIEDSCSTAFPGLACACCSNATTLPETTCAAPFLGGARRHADRVFRAH